MTRYGQRKAPKTWRELLSQARQILTPHLDDALEDRLPRSEASGANTSAPESIGITYTGLDNDRDPARRKLADAARIVDGWMHSLGAKDRPRIPDVKGEVETDLTLLVRYAREAIDYAGARADNEPQKTASDEGAGEPAHGVESRNAYFRKQHKQGLKPKEIEKRWRGMSQSERTAIAPEASGTVNWETVRKAVYSKDPVGSKPKRRRKR